MILRLLLILSKGARPVYQERIVIHSAAHLAEVQFVDCGAENVAIQYIPVDRQVLFVDNNRSGIFSRERATCQGTNGLQRPAAELPIAPGYNVKARPVERW